MEKNLNVFATVCKEYNRETNSIIGIYNKVEIENDRMDLCVFTELIMWVDLINSRILLWIII